MLQFVSNQKTAAHTKAYQMTDRLLTCRILKDELKRVYHKLKT